MAYRKVFGSNDEDKESDLQSGIVGGSSAPQGGAGGQPASAWTNLQTYLKANEGQGAGIANAITQKTQENIDAVGKNVQDWETAAKGNVDKATKKDDYSGQIKKDPTKVDQNAFSAWKNLGNYWGNQDSTQDSGYADVYRKVQGAANDIKGANDYYGQNVLAKKSFSGDGAGQSTNYTDGMGYLDTFIARADQSGKDAFANFKDRNAGFDQKLGNATSNVNSYIQGADARGKSAYDSAMKAVSGRQKEIEDSVNERFLSEQENAFNDAQNQIAARYKASGVEAPPNTLGWLTPSQGSKEAYYDDPEIAALNSLAGLDNDDSTNGVARSGNKTSYGIDWNSVDSDVAKKAEKAAIDKKAAADFAASNGILGADVNDIRRQQEQTDAAARQGFATAGGFTGQAPIDISNTQPEIDYRASNAFEDAGGFVGNILQPPIPKPKPVPGEVESVGGSKRNKQLKTRTENR